MSLLQNVSFSIIDRDHLFLVMQTIIIRYTGGFCGKKWLINNFVASTPWNLVVFILLDETSNRCETLSTCSDALFINEAELVTLFVLCFLHVSAPKYTVMSERMRNVTPIIKLLVIKSIVALWNKENAGIMQPVLPDINIHLVDIVGVAKTFQEIHNTSLRRIYTRGKRLLVQ